MKAVKWILIIGGGLVVLVMAALILIPMFVDVNKHKPGIENWVSENTGRPFAIGGDLRLSLFPWAGFSFTDLSLGNPSGYEQKNMLSIRAFEVRVKLLPLISKDIQVKRFVMENPRIVLVKDRNGRGNWEGIGEAASTPTPKAEEREAETPPTPELQIKSIAVGELAVTSGSILWIDESAKTRNEVDDLTLVVREVSHDRPVPLSFSARVDKKPISAEGTVGPLGRDFGLGKLPIDLVIKALGRLQMALKGHLEDVSADPRFDVAVDVSEFSPRKLMAALDQEFPVKTADPDVLNRIALKARVIGDADRVSIENGTLNLDDSTVTFSAKAKDFSRPELWFKMEMDAIDADRYLPPDEKTGPEEKSKEQATGPGQKTKTDYTPLRRLILDGHMKIGKLKAANARMENVRLTVKAKGGVIQISPAMAMYGGDVNGRAVVNVVRDTPKTEMRLSARELQVNPLLNDVMKKDFLEGATEARVQLTMRGDDPQTIKKSLNGEGQLRFKDGAVKGIDLASMARNVKSAFGLAPEDGPKPRTDFSELWIPFRIQKGVVKTADASLLSPFIRVKAKGTANLVSEALDMRVEPKIVGTLKGQGDTMDRGGLTVPVLVSGTFEDPKFEPDLAGMLTGGSGSSPEDVVKGITGDSEDIVKSAEEQVKGVLKGLPFGN